MKKLLQVGLVIALVFGTMTMATGCGSKESTNMPYSSYNLEEYVKVAEYKGLEYEEPEVNITQDDIDKEIQERLASHKDTKEITKGTVKDGDTINISFEGKIDGETFEGGTSDSFDLTVGQTSMIDGFVEGLVGQKVGSTVTLDLEFPDPYPNNTELSGKPVTFEINIKCKKEYITPEYDLEFVTNNYPDYDSIEAFEDGVKADLTSQQELKNDSQVRQTLWAQIVEGSEVLQYPEEKDNLINDTLQNFKDDATNQGLEWDAYLAQGGYDEEQLTENISAYAENQVKQELILYAIAKAEGLEVSDDEYKEFMNNMLTEAGFDEESFQSYTGQTIEEYCEEQGLMSSMLLDKVMEKIVEYANAKN